MGQTSFYVIYLAAVEHTDPNNSDTTVPLPPDGLSVNGQAVLNTGLTNGDGTIMGTALISSPAGEIPPLIIKSTPLDGYNDVTITTQAVLQAHLAICDANNANADLTLQTNTVIAGQQMDWSAQLELTNGMVITNFPLSNFQWTVPGYVISNYVVAADASSAIVVTNFPVNNTNVVFYWVDGGSNLTAQCSTTVSGHSITGQAVFNVARPTATLSVITTSNFPPVNIVTNIVGSMPPTNEIDLQYGTFNGSSGQLGLYVSISIATPTNGAGSFGYLQVINQTLRQWVLYPSGTRQKIQATNLIDSALGISIWSQTNVMGSASNTLTGAYFDSPAQILNVYSFSTSSASAADEFSGYVVYRPSGETNQTIWVTLQKFTWNWSGAATMSTNGIWSLGTGYPSPSHSQPVDSSELPQWNGTPFNLPILPDN